MSSIEVDDEDRDLFHSCAWHVIHHTSTPRVYVAHCLPGPRKSNIYLKDMIWNRMGFPGRATVADGNGLNLTRANLVPKRGNQGAQPGSTRDQPSPLTHLGLGRHKLESPGLYAVCEAEEIFIYSGKPFHVCGPVVGYARRVPGGWQSRPGFCLPWSQIHPRFYDAVLGLAA